MLSQTSVSMHPGLSYTTKQACLAAGIHFDYSGARVSETTPSVCCLNWGASTPMHLLRGVRTLCVCLLWLSGFPRSVLFSCCLSVSTAPLDLHRRIYRRGGTVLCHASLEPCFLFFLTFFLSTSLSPSVTVSLVRKDLLRSIQIVMIQQKYCD